MARPRTLPDNDQIVQHLQDDWTYQQIADEYGTTREAVSALIARYRLAPPKIGRHHAYIPWTIAPEHRRDAELRKLRYYSKRMQGEELTAAEEKSLDNWLAELDTVVVTYSREEGFDYVPRLPEDGDGFVRVPAEAQRQAG